MLARWLLSLLMGYALTSISIFAYQQIPACNGKVLNNKARCYIGPDRCGLQDQTDCWPNESAVRYDGTDASEEQWQLCLDPTPPQNPKTSHCIIKSLKCCKQKKCKWQVYDPPLPPPPDHPDWPPIYGRCIVDDDYVNGEGQLVWLYTNGATYLTCTNGNTTYDPPSKEEGD